MKLFSLALMTALTLPLATVHAADNQTDKDAYFNLSNDRENSTDNPSTVKRLIDFLYGKPVNDGFIYLPFGAHTNSERFKEITKQNMLGLFHNSFGFGTFVNSFDDRIWYLVHGRNVVSYNDFGLDYYVGAIHGYKGFLSTLPGLPFHDTFIFKGNLNPIISMGAYYQLTDQVQLHTVFLPGIVLAGMKYNF